MSIEQEVIQAVLEALRTANIATRDDLTELARLTDEKLLRCSRGGERPPSEEMDAPSRIEYSDDARLRLKQELAQTFWKSAKRMRISQQEAGRLVGMSQQKVSDLMRLNVHGLSERKILDCLVRIGCDVEITVRPGSGQIKVDAVE